MIKYRLICKDCEATFDSWFPSSKEYERLKKKDFINCHICSSLNVEKTLMSPSVFTAKNNFKIDSQIKEYKKINRVILKYQRFIKKNFNYVGENFTHEVRSVHYKNIKPLKGIYGTATKEEIKELKEEGIETEVIPWIKDNTN
jgi:hypothetical protein|tara:strand:+ start:314 stop:742 length:429 start_codon:yes stop_codon:yes gene_type:complete